MSKPQSPAKPAAAAEKKPYFKVVATNRRARHDYTIEESLEAGLVLHGSEVKSLRAGKVDFADSYARVYEGQCWLVGLRISPYEKAFVEVPIADRRRKLLLKKREIQKLQARMDRAGYTVVPLEVYFHGNWAKVKLGICRGKTKADKRQALRKDEARREVDRAMKMRNRG
ncbi:MAG: SsrA-binding protein SmpB [Planctomycetota bacterium]|nr:SsrA-binding protein SmpB [Planctomycetota bacterium]